MAFADYQKGKAAAQDKAVAVNFGDIGVPPGDHSADWNDGWSDIRWQVNRLKGRDGKDGRNGRDGANGVDGAPGADGATGPAGPPGPQGPKGDTAVLAAGTGLRVE